jgi:putative ABC transport system substrate-binding protein
MRKLFCQIVCLAGAVIALAGAPVPTPRIPHIVILMEGRNIRPQPQVNGLRDGLEELKYVEGNNLNWKLMEGGTEEELRANLRSVLQRQRVDVIVTLGTTETAVARETAPHVPIVFLPDPDPVESGFVRSLANPGTNLTGLTFFIDREGVGKQLEVFSQLVPSLRNVAVILDRRLRPAAGSESWDRLTAVARSLRIQLNALPVTSAAEASRKIEALSPGGATIGVFVICSGLFKDLEELASTAAKRKLPLFGCNAFQVAEQNVLASYAPDLYSLGYRGAWFVERIVKGEKPQGIPVETPRKFELVINKKTARQTGLRIPSEMLMLADRVFN